MKPTLLAGSVLGLTLVGLALASPAGAQTRMTAGVRGKVVDEQGKGIEGVTIDLEFKGESRLKITKTHVTDKKGGFVRMGLRGGPWRLAFSKPGYETYQLDTDLSDGGFSEVPDIVMKVAKAAAPPPPVIKDEVVPMLPPESATMKDVYNKAVDASRAGNLDDAERLYKEVLEKLPNLAEVHYNLGHVYVRKNDLASAQAEFRKALELQAQRAEFYIALAAIYGLDGKTQQAADLMIQAKGSFEEDAKFQYALGTAALNVGRNDEASPAFRKVVKLDPANAEAHFFLGSVAVGENKVAEAIAELEKYLAMSGQDPQNLATAKALLAALKRKK